jgi:hypothetical protein
VNYDEFKHAWITALRGSGLLVFGVDPVQESLELHSLDRRVVSVVEVHPQREPFTITAQLSCRWDALNTARTATTEEDMLAELLGRDHSTRSRTARPWLRVDIALRASLPLRQPLPMPSRPMWAAWTRDVMETLETRAPLIPVDTVREARRGELEILGTMDEPEAEIECKRDGDTGLAAVSIEAWQAIELARKWSDSSRRPDKGVHEQLDAMFARIRAALRAWAELTIHLRNAN